MSFFLLELVDAVVKVIVDFVVAANANVVVVEVLEVIKAVSFHCC